MSDNKTPTPPSIALTIAGSDSSGGAGIQADLKTFAAHGVYGASVLTALTAQNTTGVYSVHQVPPEFVEAQMAAVGSDLTVNATKTGMLFDTGCIEAVGRALDAHRFGPLIVDPVMIATSGDQLLADDAIDAMKSIIITRAEIITPNLAEAARLLGQDQANDVDLMITQAQALMKLGPGAVLVKGGHGEAGDAVDVFFDGKDVAVISHPRVASQNTHGTGCTLSAAIAANRASGMALRPAVESAKTFVWEAILAAKDTRLGNGHGPVDHLYKIRGA